VVCWGNNGFGELSPPTPNFLQVSAGAGYVCGVKPDATLACWGRNDVSQASPPPGNFQQVSAGLDFACALRTGRESHVLGNPSDGQAPANPP